MKKLIVTVVAAFALVAVAAPVKIASVQITDVAGVVSAATKLGEFTGNAMLGAMAAAQVSQNPLAQFFGPGREGAATLVTVFQDGELPKAEAFHGMASNVFSVAFVYPATRAKAQFLENFPEATETNGVIAVNGTGFLGKGFVRFTADGKWAVASDRKDLIPVALKEISTVTKPLGSRVLRMRITAKGIDTALKVIDMAQGPWEKDGNASAEDLVQAKAAMKLVKDFYGQVAGAMVDLSVTEKGLDVGIAAKPRVGTDLDLVGKKTLPADPLAFAGADAFLAAAAAEDAGQGSPSKQSDALYALLAKYGIDTRWLAREKTAKGEKFTLDFDGAVAYFQGEGAATFAKIDPLQFMKDFSAIGPKEIEIKGPAYSGSFALKGEKFAKTASERFAAVLPEAAAKKPYLVEMISFYAFVKALAPKLVAFMPEEQRPVLKPMIDTLPPAGDGGIAVVGWREKDLISGLVRVSPDEFRGISAIVNVGMGYFMMQAMNSMPNGAEEFELEGPDEDDDED